MKHMAETGRKYSWLIQAATTLLAVGVVWGRSESLTSQLRDQVKEHSVVIKEMSSERTQIFVAIKSVEERLIALQNILERRQPRNQQ